ncbi:hypothetical protein BKA69DRAFT_1120909 [Paraphysoderma sedebokerense]|nr:hypothetical protein BKA69DRAFT_1120909 [Paraphysoderma sedebokerense]
MSSIVKLLISGIRSFDPDAANVIEFYSPLTLIVGHNGSGKTTIIECLKYATSGELPPNTKGTGAFIHDPKLAHKSEVKAQVKLKFRNVNRKLMVCIRSRQLTQKAKKTEERTLESVLETKDPVTGERMSISSKCADLDQEMPINLGVPKAVLDNVIFCHQEDSNWHASVRTKYTKALDNIKSIRKERADALKVEVKDLEWARSNHQRSNQLRAQIAMTRNQIDDKNAKCLNVSEKLKDITDKTEKLINQLSSLQSIDQRLQTLQLERQMLYNAMEDLKQHMIEFEESDTELLQLLEQHKRNLSTASSDKLKFEAELHRLKNEIAQYNAQKTNKLTRRGHVQNECDNERRQLRHRDNTFQELSRKHNIIGLNNTGSSSAQDFVRFGEKLQQKLNSSISRIEDVKRENRSRENALLQVLQEKKSDVAKKEADRRNANQQKEMNFRKIRSFQQRISTTNVTLVDISGLEQRITEDQRILQESQKALSDMLTDGKLDNIKNQLDTNVHKMARLNEELMMVSAQADTRAKLSSRKSDLERKESYLSQIVNEVNANVVKVLGEFPPMDQLEYNVENFIRMRGTSIYDKERRMETANRQLSAVETRIHMFQSQLQSKEVELQDKTNSLNIFCGGRDYPELLKETEEKFVDARESFKALESMRRVYAGYKTKAVANHDCPVCKQIFENDDKVDQFVRRIDATIQMIPRQLEDIQNEIATYQNNLDELRGQSGTWEDILRLRDTEIPDLQRKLDQVTGERDQAQTAVDTLQTDLGVAKKEESMGRELRSKAREISQLRRDIDQIKQDITALEQELRITGSTKTMEQLKQEIDQLTVERFGVVVSIFVFLKVGWFKGKLMISVDFSVTLRREKERYEIEMRHKQTEVDGRRNKISAAQNELNRKKADLKEKETFEKSIEELSRENVTFDNTLKGLHEEIERMKQDTSSMEVQLARTRNESMGKEAEAQSLVDNIRPDVERWRHIDAEVQRLAALNLETELSQLESDLNAIEQSISQLNARYTEITDEIKTIDKNLSDIQSLERNISDNMKYRKLKIDIAEQDRKIAELEVSKQEHDQKGYQGQLDEYREKSQQYIQEESRLQGEIAQLQLRLLSDENSLNGDYKDADLRYQRQIVKVKTTEMAISDLEKYSKALDSAIMKYHSLKMEEINKIIRELWVNTYQGNDIDTIEIRSDNENARGNRSYNYRVVMIKDDTELDMRGRCSAGQKVLTSIIIRLALAETFCLNCGILALDEPTTNLDRANIESLAESLANIIKVRRQQSNFQLIVITHDEEFMQLLGKSEFADYYWRVYKDRGQHSVIERQSIAADT